MWSLIVEAIVGAPKAVFGLGASKEPTAVDLATQAATTATDLESEQEANNVLQEASAAGRRR